MDALLKLMSSLTICNADLEAIFKALVGETNIFQVEKQRDRPHCVFVYLKPFKPREN